MVFKFHSEVEAFLFARQLLRPESGCLKCSIVRSKRIEKAWQRAKSWLIFFTCHIIIILLILRNRWNIFGTWSILVWHWCFSVCIRKSILIPISSTITIYILFTSVCLQCVAYLRLLLHVCCLESACVCARVRIYTVCGVMQCVSRGGAIVTTAEWAM